jgi:NADH-quinone oxidoreductase subunit E
MSIVDAEAPLEPCERSAICDFAAHYPTSRAGCIEALRYLQQRRNYISDAIFGETAALLDMSPAELDEVATFYNLIFRRPVGDTVLLVCDSISCWMMGRDRLVSQISARLGIREGETSADGSVTLLPIVCLGHCDHAPALMAGDRLYGDVDAEKLDEVLRALGSEPRS